MTISLVVVVVVVAAADDDVVSSFFIASTSIPLSLLMFTFVLLTPGITQLVVRRTDHHPNITNFWV